LRAQRLRDLAYRSFFSICTGSFSAWNRFAKFWNAVRAVDWCEVVSVKERGSCHRDDETELHGRFVGFGVGMLAMGRRWMVVDSTCVED
jgi:hypothetical protein